MTMPLVTIYTFIYTYILVHVYTVLVNSRPEFGNKQFGS